MGVSDRDKGSSRTSLYVLGILVCLNTYPLRLQLEASLVGMLLPIGKV